MNSSEEFWTVDNVSLHQYGWSVTTIGGARYDLPPRRGSNLTLAYRPGQIHRRKLPDQRVITLLMFMVGWKPGTGSAADWIDAAETDQRTQWNDNWDFLRRLVYRAYTSNGLVRLGRRWRLTQPEFPTTRTGDIAIQGDPGVPEPGSQIMVASAAAEMTGDMAPQMTGRLRAEFQYDFTLADPYFYGPEVLVTLDPDDYVYVWNDGNDTAGHEEMWIDLVGPLTNPVITNHSTDPNHWVKYTGTIPAGKTVRLHIGRYTAQLIEGVSSTGGTNRIGLVSNSGSRLWLMLLHGNRETGEHDPSGVNKLRLTADSGSGHAELRFRPPYV